MKKPGVSFAQPRPLIRWSVHAAIVILLTALTQIGGLAWLAAMLLSRRFRGTRRAIAVLAMFVPLYGLGSALASVAAPVFGRVPLPCLAEQGATMHMQSMLYCVLNRQYVVPELKTAALALAAHMNSSFPGTTTLTLDGNFPFFDGFALLPHLSHSDGRKLDIAFYYNDVAGVFRDGETRSPLGYFAFEQPREGAASPCEGRDDVVTMRWDLAALQSLWSPMALEEKRTSEAIRWLSDEGRAYGIAKIFVEPHLAERLGVSAETIKFQGCRAARHDDHIHIQVSK
ncbi:hypothetical protein J2Z19_000968 [Ensifer adhaerens]|uniref:Uncharacterized protein n=1 Tax=Ensifer adhaerens TaxID=106592 RepID=A0ACC5SRG6_ENSAD|nr:hypothetical protein [Ensifer adhaerens]MBP1871271.1 hypothetical protein [Ensifer adhaerens]